MEAIPDHLKWWLRTSLLKKMSMQSSPHNRQQLPARERAAVNDSRKSVRPFD
jgi:hypothetical protein